MSIASSARTRQGARHVAIMLVLLLAAPAPLAAQTSPRQMAADMSRELMSPFCPGKLLADCTSSQAFELRDTITARLTAGESASAIKSDLVRQYGRAILGAPEARGAGLLAWILPALIGLATALGIGLKVARATSDTLATRADPAPAAAAVDAGSWTRLDDELRELD